MKKKTEVKLKINKGEVRSLFIRRKWEIGRTLGNNDNVIGELTDLHDQLNLDNSKWQTFNDPITVN